MTTYFLDSSALVKRHVAEPGHAWIVQITDPTAGNVIVISAVALVEVTASFARMSRERPRRLSRPNRDRLSAYFALLAQSEYESVQMTHALLVRADGLCRTHPLRAYDAIQLACALTRRDDDIARGLPAPLFVCADTHLLDAAAAEGLPTENPNLFP